MQASTSTEHWATKVDTQMEKPSFWVEGTLNLLGKQVLYPQTNAMTQEVLLVKSSDPGTELQSEGSPATQLHRSAARTEPR